MKTYTDDLLPKLRYKFESCELIKTNYSQVYQDMFVLTMLDGKRDGIFVEIGASHPISINNTFLLESQFNWDGISIDIADFYSFKNTRRSKFLCQDALTIDYKKLFEDHKLPFQIDYLQVDIDPNYNTLSCLKRLPLEDYRFSVITYETDVYDPNMPRDQALKNRQESRDILLSHGYEMLVGNICNLSTSDPFEDWYVDPNIISKEIIDKMRESSEYNNTAESYMFDL